jgi:hypothetical protein
VCVCVFCICVFARVCVFVHIYSYKHVRVCVPNQVYISSIQSRVPSIALRYVLTPKTNQNQMSVCRHHNSHSSGEYGTGKTANSELMNMMEFGRINDVRCQEKKQNSKI